MPDDKVPAFDRPAADLVYRSLAPKKCPRCGSPNVRRAHFQSRDEAQRHVLTSPYRCEECNERFWLLSRKTRHTTIAILALVVASVIIASVMPMKPPPLVPPPAPASVELALPDVSG